MEKFEILWELPQGDTETQSERMLLENGTNTLVQPKVATVHQFEKNSIICEVQ